MSELRKTLEYRRLSEKNVFLIDLESGCRIETTYKPADLSIAEAVEESGYNTLLPALDSLKTKEFTTKLNIRHSIVNVGSAINLAAIFIAIRKILEQV